MTCTRHLPGSPWSRLCCEPGCCDIGPGVPPEPGDRSSFPWPPYDNEDEGGLCKRKDEKRK